jgi:GAF domain-containing protein/HAMP domain-containing protein
MILRNSVYAILILLFSILLFTYLVLNKPDKYADELLFIMLLACLGLLYGVLYFLLLQPLARLAEKSAKIAAGDLTQNLNQSAVGEIGEIANSFIMVVNNINEATDFIKKVEIGKIDLASNALKGDDQLSNALRTMSWQMQKITEAEYQRNWATEGTAQFVSILRSNNDDIQALCDNIISHLVQYVKAQQGGLFIVNDITFAMQERYLDLYACYAYQENRLMEKRVEIGEGLVGQTYVQGETLLLEDVPDDYIKILSGLGEATPKHLLIVPMKVNQQVFGIVELASFFKFEPYQIDFIEKLGENIAATVANVKSNEKTKKLLGEAQIIAEQLRSQEEEMRQNVEELQSTQEEMHRKQRELEVANKKMESNENILKKAFEKAKQREKELEGMQKEVKEVLEVSKMQEEEMMQNMEYFADKERKSMERIKQLETELAKYQ